MPTAVERSTFNVTGRVVTIVLEMESDEDAMKLIDATVKERRMTLVLGGDVTINDNR